MITMGTSRLTSVFTTVPLMRVGTPPPLVTGFFFGTGLSNRVFAKGRVGSTVFLFTIRLVTGHLPIGKWAECEDVED